MLDVQRDRPNKNQMTRDDYSNSEVLLLIRDRIHKEKYWGILEDRLVRGLTFEKIAEAHDMSVRQIKNIVYKCEDKIFR